MVASILYRVLCWMIGLLARLGGTDRRDLEVAVLRHQLKILARRASTRPRYTVADRAFLAAASRLLPRERWSCFLVGPDTLARWHRDLLRGTRRGCIRRPGRPPLEAWIRELILRMARENPRWGYMRIRGELLKLGIDVSATTIATMLRRGGLGPARRRIGPTWTQFLRLQAFAILSGETRTDGDDWFEDLAHESGRDAQIPRLSDDDGPAQLDDEAVCAAPRLVRHEERAPIVEIVQSHETVAASRPPMLGARPRDRPEPPLDLVPQAAPAHELAGFPYAHAA